MERKHSYLINKGHIGEPFVTLYGAYFPSWLICAMIGIISTVLIRIVLIRLGVDEGIPLRTIVYIALASMITLTLAITVLEFSDV